MFHVKHLALYFIYANNEQESCLHDLGDSRYRKSSIASAQEDGFSICGMPAVFGMTTMFSIAGQSVSYCIAMESLLLLLSPCRIQIGVEIPFRACMMFVFV